MLKIAAAVLVVGGIWVWVSGRSVTEEIEAQARPVQLSAATILAPGADQGAFDEEGTIILDRTQGQSGEPYILYTEYSPGGKPSVKTKRLVFGNRDVCADLGLLCATNQADAPVSAEEKVRIVGTVKNEIVEVSEIYRL